MIDRRCRTSEADVDRTVHLVCCAHHLACLYIIRGTHDRHARNRAHEGEVLTALMRCTVLTDGYAAVCRADLDIQMRIPNGISYLLVCTSRRKHGKGGDKGDEPHRRETRTDIRHIAFRNPAVKMALRKHLLKCPRLRCAGKVGIQNDNIRMFLAEFSEGVPVAVTRCNFFHICHAHASSIA